MSDLCLHNVRNVRLIAVCREFRTLMAEMPEISRCGSVEIKGRRIEGPRILATAVTVEEIMAKVPEIVAQLADPASECLIITSRSGECFGCYRYADCPAHDLPSNGVTSFCADEGLLTRNSNREIDISKYLAAALVDKEEAPCTQT